MNNKIKLLTLGLGLSLSLSLFSANVVNEVKDNNNPNNITYAWSGPQVSDAPSNYYDGTANKTGESLRTTIRDLNRPKSTSYSWSRYEYADEMENDDTSVLSIYTRHAIKKSKHVGSGYSWDTWNREHIFTQTRFPRSDADNHNIFACEGEINNTRSNYKFNEVAGNNYESVHGHKTGCQFDGTYFEPCDEAKGEVARAVLYCCVQYDYKITEIFHDEETCLKWHNEHPVSYRDIIRNNRVYEQQGNRNPFVDHPEFASLIWGGESYPDTPSETLLSNISFTSDSKLNKTAYVEGEEWSTDGLKVMANYTDGTSKDVTKDTIFKFNPAKATMGTTDLFIIAQYKEGEVKKNTNKTFKVTVSEAPANNHKGANNNTGLIVGLSVAGGVIVIAGIVLTIVLVKKKKQK